MIERLSTLFLASMRALTRNARSLLWFWALMGVAGLIGGVGFGFVVFAGHAALRPVLGPELAALVVGLSLLGLAALLVWITLSKAEKPADETPLEFLPLPPLPAEVPPNDPMTLAVFTAAFVIGRRLSGQRD